MHAVVYNTCVEMTSKRGACYMDITWQDFIIGLITKQATVELQVHLAK
jgi:hypothetical protein